VADGNDGTGGGMDDESDPEEAAGGAADGEKEESGAVGGNLSTAEKNALLNWNCDSVVKGNMDFGPPTIGVPNYALFLGRCPNGCSELGEAKVFGIGIHPENSGICKSAIYD